MTELESFSLPPLGPSCSGEQRLWEQWAQGLGFSKGSCPPPAGLLRSHVSQRLHGPPVPRSLSPCSPAGATHPGEKPEKGPMNVEDTSEVTKGTRDELPTGSMSLRNTPAPLPQALPGPKPWAWTAAQSPLGMDASTTPTRYLGGRGHLGGRGRWPWEGCRQP